MAEWQFATSNPDVFGKVVWSESGASSSTNKSTVKAAVYYYRDDSLKTYGTVTGTLTINGTGKSLSKYVELTASSGWVEIGENSVSVTHSSDGSKSITISWSGGFGSGVSAGNQSTSKTVTLTKIARASTPTTNPTALTLGTAFTIKTNRASSSFTHKIHIWWGYKDKNNYTEKWITNVGDSVSVTLTEAEGWASYLPNSASGVLGISCETFSESTSLGTTQITRVMSLPASWAPTAGTVTATAAKPFGEVDYLQGYSTVTTAMSGAAASHGAAIDHYGFYDSSGEYATSTSSSATSETIKNSGKQTYGVTVYDSRGLKASATTTINVTAYTAPTVSLSARRCDDTGSYTEVGDYIKAAVTGTMDTLSGSNSSTVKVEYKKTSVTAWTTAGTWSGQTGATFSVTSGPFAASSTISFDVRATITDATGTSTVTQATVGVGVATVDYLAGGKGVTFFGTATKEGLWNNKSYNGIRFYGGTKVVNPNGNDTVAIMTSADNSTKLGVTDSGPSNTAVFVSNGDGSAGAAKGVHVQGATYLNGTWYATLSSKVSGLIRLNYFVVHWEASAYV